jgi:chromosomal replication initiation ATPase DnaA
MQELNVKAKTVQVGQQVLEQRMIEDIREMDMDALTDLFQYMYPVKVDDVQGMEGEEVIVTVDESQMSGGDLNDIFG